MTGIERLRQMAKDFKNVKTAEHCTFIVNTWRGRYIDDAIADIVEQIEREQGGRVSRMRVLSVVTEMERHVSGVEGTDDSPVARWARELREALGGDGRDHAADVSVSAYDLLPKEDRDALTWVRDHGGLDHVRSQWGYLKGRANHADHVDRHLEKRQRQIDECHEALRRRNQRIAVLASEINRAHNENYIELMRRAGNYTDFADEVCKRLAPQLRCVEGCTKGVMDAALEAIDRRLMPEGCEWPRYESGELVMLGDTVIKYVGGGTIKVRSVEFLENMTYLRERFKTDQIAIVRHGERVKRPTVLAADGKPLLKHETVYEIKTGERYFVTNVFDGMTEPDFPEHTVECRKYEDVVTHMFRPSQLTHTKPESPDSWQRIEEDAKKYPCHYFGHERNTCDGCPAHSVYGSCKPVMTSDLVRRCKALAEKENRNE